MTSFSRENFFFFCSGYNPNCTIRSFTDGSKSQVRNNRITNLFSSNATHVIGIHVQGDAKGFDIVGNMVDLKAAATFDVSDVYSALIIGKNADEGGTSGTIAVHGNTFAQEYLIQNGSNDTNDSVLIEIENSERRLRGVQITDTGSASSKQPQGHVKTNSAGKCPLGYT
jgi:hypothetical protein